LCAGGIYQALVSLGADFHPGGLVNISRPTALILGAGASKDYGYPTGRELSQEIIVKAQRGREIWSVLERLNHEPAKISDFLHQFSRSHAPSIDTFLGNRPEFAEIGKHAIAAALIPYEQEERLLAAPEERWYDFLWRRMWDGRSATSRLAIVTFNYDRSLEKFLSLGLQASFAWDLDRVARFFRDFSLVHVYGTLGPLPEISEGGRPYLNQASLEAVRSAADTIRVISDDRRNDVLESLSIAANYLQNAERICFLGFGFDTTNLERLGLPTLQNPKGIEFYATAIGLGQAERDDVVKKLRGRDVRFGDPDEDSLAVLKRYPVLF
jgi:hypothetical protein